MDKKIERWADRERRSKREHITYIVEKILESYEHDPFILQRLAINAGRTDAISA